MTIITLRDRIRTIADRWREQYPLVEKYYKRPDREDIWIRLKNLNKETASPKDVADIIGNASWTYFYCASCQTYLHEDFVVFDNACVCRKCLKEAYENFVKESS